MPEGKADGDGPGRTNAPCNLQGVRDCGGGDSGFLQSSGDQTGRQVTGASGGDEEDSVHSLLPEDGGDFRCGFEFEAKLFSSFDVTHNTDPHGMKFTDDTFLSELPQAFSGKDKVEVPFGVPMVIPVVCDNELFPGAS
jgi:hypothetical protein